MKRACFPCLFQFLIVSVAFSQSSTIPILPTAIQGSHRPIGTPFIPGQERSFGSLQSRMSVLPRSDALAYDGNALSKKPQPGHAFSDQAFLAAPVYGSGGTLARSLAIADVNGDGVNDVVVVNEFGDSADPNNGNVEVLLGKGDGTFQTAVSYPYNGNQATSVVVADVNRDGKPDILLAIACANSPQCTIGGVGVLLGNGDGTFQPSVTVNSGQYNDQSLAVADVNRDGKLDLLLTFYCTSSCTADGGVAVFLGNGDGTFQAPVTYGSGGFGTTSVAVADANGDNKLDLFVGGCGGHSSCVGGGVSLMLGNGDGTFAAPVNFYSGGQPSFLSVADVNKDGSSDLILGNGGVVVALGNGDGSFRAPVTYASGGLNPASLAVEDLNDDGSLDLLVANECVSSGSCTDASGNVSVLFGKGDGTFKAAVQYGSGGNDAVSVAVGDVIDGGKPFVAVANECFNTTNCQEGSVGVLPGKGNGVLLAAATNDSGEYGVQSLAMADVNRDGKPDLLLANQCRSASDCAGGSVSVLLGKGDGTFQPAVTYDSGGFTATSVAVGDVNKDGKPDLVVANQCTVSNSCGFGNGDVLIGVLLGNGDGTFQPAATFSAGGVGNPAAHPLTLEDVNKDGKVDLIISNCASFDNCGTGGVAVLLGNGDGTFQPEVNYNPGGFRGNFVAVGDLNKDGKLDLVVANECDNDINCGVGTLGSVGVLLGNGDGTFKPAVAYESGGYNAAAVALGDVNGDGKLDLLIANECDSTPNCSNGASGSVSVLLGNGDGTFGGAVSIATPGQNIGALEIGDFNGDGMLDVASGTGGTLLLGNGDGTFRGPLALGAFGPGIDMADLNMDGKPDLVVGGATVLLNNSISKVQLHKLLRQPPSALKIPIGSMTTVISVNEVGGFHLDLRNSE